MSVRRVQLRRGTSAENNAFTGAVGEITVDTTKSTIRVHDGATQGGTETTLTDLSNISPSADVDFNAQKIINVSDPTNAQDVATKAYVDSGGGIAIANLTDVSIANIAEAHILVYDNDNDGRWENVALSGDITISATGLSALTADAIQTVNIQDAQVTNAKLENSTITISDGVNTDDLPLGQTLTFTATASETTVAVTADGNNANGAVVTIGLPDDVTIGQDLTVSRDLTVTGNLTVNGTTTTINTNQITVEDPIMIINNGDAANDAGLFITNPGAEGDQLFIFDNTDQIFKLAQAPNGTSGSDTNFNPTDFSDLKLKDLTTTGAVSIATTLGVTGITTLTGALNANGGIAVDTNAFIVADTTGNTTIAGTLDVTGQSTLASGSTVGDIEITDGQIQTTNANNNLSFNDNNLSTTGTLEVGSTSTFTGDLTASGSILVEKDADHSIILNSDVVGDNTPQNASIAVATSNAPAYSTITWTNASSTWALSHNASTATDLTVGQDLIVTRNLYLTDSSTNGITFRHDEAGGADETLIRVDRGASYATLSWDESSTYFSVSQGLNIVGAISQGAVDGASNFTVSNTGVITSDSNGHQLAGLTFSGTTIEASVDGSGIDFGNEDVSTTGDWSSADITSTGTATLATVNVSGLLTASGGISADNFSVADTTGNTSVGGTLEVTGQSILASGSTVGDIEITDGQIQTTNANNNLSFNDNNLSTTGTLSTGGATVTSLSISDGNITNVGDISLDSISSDGSTVQILMDDNVAGSFEILEGLNSYIKIDTTDGSELITVGKETTFSGVANFSSTLNADNALTVDGLLTANGGISADNFSIADTTGNVSASGTITVDGLLTANGGISADNFSVADTTGNTSVGGTLNVTSTITATAQGSQVADFTFNNGSLTSATGTIDFGDENLTTTGTLSTGGATVTSLSVSDGNITNVGDISLDTISSDGSTVQVVMDDNVAGSFEILEGLNSYIKIDTTDGSELITISKDIVFTGSANFSNAQVDLSGGNVTVNENGSAFNFRVEGDTQTHLLFTDGTNDRVGINESSPSTQFHVNGVTTLAGALNVRSDDLNNNADAQNAIVLLNSDATGNGAERDAKIEVERGTLTNSYIQWDESEDEWLISNALNSAGNVTVGADVFTVASATGNTSVGGTLGVTGILTASAQGAQIADFTFNNGSLTSATGTIDFGDENLTTTGSVTCTNMTVNGTLTTINSTDLEVTDSVIRLNKGIAGAANSRDIGIIMERGTTGDDAIFFFDEDDDIFKMGLTQTASTATDFTDPTTWGDLKIGTLTTTSTVTSAGIINANGGIAIDTNGFTVDGANYGLATTGVITVTNTGANAFKVETAGNAEIFNIDTNTPKVTITSALFEPDAGINVGADVFTVSSAGVTSILNTLNVTTGSATAFVVEAANGTDVLNVDTTSSITTVTGQLKTDDLRASSAGTGSFKINLVNNIANALEIKDLGAAGDADSYMTFNTTEGSELITLAQPTALSSTLEVTGVATLKSDANIESSNTNGIVFNSDLTGLGQETDAVIITVERGTATNAVMSWDESEDEFNLNTSGSLHLQGKIAGNALTVGDTSSAGVTTAVLTTAGALTLSSSLTVSGIDMGETAISNVTDIAVNTISDNDGDGIVVQLSDSDADALVIKQGAAGESYITIDTNAETLTLNQSTTTSADLTVTTTLDVTGQSTLDDTLNIKASPTNSVAILLNSDSADVDLSIFKVNDTTANVQLDWDDSEDSFVVKGGKLHSETQVTVGGTITTAPNFTVATTGALSTESTVTASGNITTSNGVVGIDTPSLGAITFNSDNTAELDAHDFGLTVSRPSAGTDAIFFWDESENVWQFNSAGNVQVAGTLVADSDAGGAISISSGQIVSASGSISFDNENITTTGTLDAGVTTITSLNVTADGLTSITLNSDLGAVAPSANVGLTVNRGSSTDATLFYDELSGDTWKIDRGDGNSEIILTEEDTLFSLTTDSGGGSSYSFNQSTNNAFVINGTANEIDVTNSNGTVTVGIPNNPTLVGSTDQGVLISGNMTVTGNFSGTGAVAKFADRMIYLGQNNDSATRDLGWYSRYGNNVAAARYAGMVYQPEDTDANAKDGVYKVFHGISTDLSLGNDLNITVADSELAPIDVSQVRGGKASGADVAGANLTISGGLSTGNQDGGSIIFETASAGGAGSGTNSATTALTINPSQRVITASDLAVGGQAVLDDSTIALAGGDATFAVTKSYHKITPDGAGNTITTITGGETGSILILQKSGGGNLVLSDDGTSGTANGLALATGSNITINNDYSTVTFIYNGTNWSLISSVTVGA